MKALVVGTREDVAGFRLAGIEGVVCSTRDEAQHAIARLDRDTLVILSADFDLEAPMRVMLPRRT